MFRKKLTSSAVLFVASAFYGMFAGSSAVASELYGVRYDDTTPLYKMNQTTGAATEIGPTGFDNIGDLTSDTRPGSYRLWGVQIASNQLLSIDPSTGAAVVAANLNSPDNITSIAFDPVSGKLYGNTTESFGAPFDALYEIDPDTGNSTFIGRITFRDVYSLGFDQGGNLYGVADATDELISINTTTGNGSLIAQLQVGLAYDIASRPEDDVMFLADTSSSHLWQLDTTNGALTDVGPYGGASPNIVGLAFSPVPEPTMLALLATTLPLALQQGWRRRRRCPRMETHSVARSYDGAPIHTSSTPRSILEVNGVCSPELGEHGATSTLRKLANALLGYRLMQLPSCLTCLVCGLLVLGVSSMTRAEIVFDNFGPGDAFSDVGRVLEGEGVGSIGNVDQAVSFTVGSNSYLVDSIAIGIFVNTSPSDGTGPLDIVLTDDSAGEPGSVLGTFPLNVNVTGKQIVTAAVGGSLQVDANTTYWVIADAKSSFKGSWNFNTVSDTGATAGRTNNGPWNLRPDDDRMALRIEGEIVPEPTSFVILGTGAMLLTAYGSRRRRTVHCY